jgi:hypothetical protein
MEPQARLGAEARLYAGYPTWAKLRRAQGGHLRVESLQAARQLQISAVMALFQDVERAQCVVARAALLAQAIDSRAALRAVEARAVSSK